MPPGGHRLALLNSAQECYTPPNREETIASNLTLVGTVHLDPHGHRLLKELLDACRPETITVDVSPYALDFRKMVGTDLTRQLESFRLSDGSLPPSIEAVHAQLKIPFEYQASEDWAERTGARVVAVGDSTESRKLLNLLGRELMNPDNLEKLAAQIGPGLSQLVEREWKRAHEQFKQRPLDSESREKMSFRDKRLSRQITEYTRFDRVVHVGGWEHLWKLSELFAELEPEVVLLNPSWEARG